MGEPPTWYRVVKAAQYLGVTPWDLEAQPYHWVLRAESAQDAEALAQKKHEKAAGKQSQR